VRDPEFLDVGGCAVLLGRGKRAMRRATRDQGFPDPAGTDGAAYWRDRDVLRWAARQGPPLSARVPLRLWPDAGEPAEFLGAVRVPQRFCRDDVVLRWSVAPGTVAVIWRCDDPIMMSLTEALGAVDADVLVTVDPDFGIDGPGVRSRNRAAPTTRADNRRDYYALSWTDLARVLGRPMPYRPLALRDPALIAAWEPGANTVTAPAQPDLDSAPLLRMAAMFDPDHATHRTLINLVRVDQDRATRGALPPSSTPSAPHHWTTTAPPRRWCRCPAPGRPAAPLRRPTAPRAW